MNKNKRAEEYLELLYKLILRHKCSVKSYKCRNNIYEIICKNPYDLIVILKPNENRK